MPQLDPTSFASQLFWLTVCFVTLYIVLAYFILPRIGNTITVRETHIKNDLEIAAKAKDQAAQIIEDYETALQDAHIQALKLAQTIRDEAQSELDKQKQDLAEKLASKLEQAETELTASRTQAMQNIKQAAQTIVGDIVHAVSGQTVETTRVEQAIKDIDI